MCRGAERELNTQANSAFTPRSEAGLPPPGSTTGSTLMCNQRSISEAFCNSQHWQLDTERLNTRQSPQHILWHYMYFLCDPTVRITFLLTLASGRNIWKSLKLPLSGSNTAVRKGKRAVLLESLFKESDSRRVPPTSAAANRDPALSCSQTSQARPFLHTRQKNAHGCSLLLPQTQPGMFGRKAEMTGTPIRLPYLEKIA